jgi:putative ABC transport system permease protein
MKWWQQLFVRFRSLFRKAELDSEMEQEMRSHIAMQTNENIDAGMAPGEARYAALREFGWVESVKEDCREQRGFSWLEDFAKDVRHGARMLWKNPGFTCAVMLTLALGIGANTAIFSIVNAVLLKQLPYPAADQIMMLWSGNPSLNLGNDLPPETLDLPEWRSQAKSFVQLAAFRPRPADISERGDPERLDSVDVTANLFSVLGIQPMYGRSFAVEEEQPGNDKVAIISHRLWLGRFGCDTDLLGQFITVNRERRRVIGIMSPEFTFPRGAWFDLSSRPEIWMPLAESADYWHHNEDRIKHDYAIIGRLKAGVPVTQAQAEMDAIAARQARQHPVSHGGWTVHLRPLALQMGGGMRRVLFLLLGVVAVVLLIACANVANLLLCRSSARRKEMAVRAAIGAGRGRVLRQLLTESLVLSSIGGGLGLLVGVWGTQLMLKFNPAHIPGLDETRLDSAVLAFTGMISLATGILFGLMPSWHASRINLAGALNDAARSSGSRSRCRTHSVLVGLEVALSFVLLAGAGLMVKSFLRLEGVDPGFNPRQVATFDLSLSGTEYRNEARGRSFFREVRARISALPGVQHVAAVSTLPLSGSGNLQGLIVEGRPILTPTRSRTPTMAQAVSPGYFATMGVTLLRGRDFTDDDTPLKPIVCIVNETLARSFFAGVDPLGKRIRLGDGTPDEANNPFGTIIGVARDVRGSGLQIQPRPEAYFPLEQENYNTTLTFVARGNAAVETVLQRAIRSEIKSLDAALPVANYRTMERVVADAVARPRFSTVLFGLFAVTALLLTVVGLYGVVAYAASQRMREIGIRIALGAQTRQVLLLVIRQGMLPALIGLVIGIAGAFTLTRLLANQLYEVKSTDPLTYCAVVVVLLLVTLFSCWLPARRAAGLDPLVALRCE